MLPTAISIDEAQVRVDPSDLRPLIKPREWLKHRPLSADGFSESPACLALSRSLVVAFTCGTIILSQRGLDRLGLSVHAAWDVCALNLERAARTPDGIEFYTRSVAHRLGATNPRGVEVRVRGTRAQSWLAHPQTFSIVHQQLLCLCRVAELTYVLPDETSLFAFFGPVTPRIAHIAAQSTSAAQVPLRWSNGFPTEADHTKPQIPFCT
ncbi:MAG: hypothetical protein SOW59_05800 [Corynebacterium sp.]|nr:hypothetical protein [Corynebacterium sp.]